MRYIIDTANDEQIQEALDMGACGVTANPSMYLKNQQNFYEFVKKYAALQLPFFSAEVMEGALEEMRACLLYTSLCISSSFFHLSTQIFPIHSSQRNSQHFPLAFFPFL